MPLGRPKDHGIGDLASGRKLGSKGKCLPLELCE